MPEKAYAMLRTIAEENDRAVYVSVFRNGFDSIPQKPWHGNHFNPQT
jgi:hypothetical protein